MAESSIFSVTYTVHIALLLFVIVDGIYGSYNYIRIQDGRDLLFACARSGNMQLVRWFAEEYEPELTLTQV